MPPTFFIFLGLIAYIGLTAISLIIFVPLLFIDSKRQLATKVIATVLISFPCLILVLILFGSIFTIPVIIFSKLANAGNIPSELGSILFTIGALIFLTLVATSALYLWYFTSKVIYQRIDHKPISEFINNDKVFKIIRSYLIKSKITKKYLNN